LALDAKNYHTWAYRQWALSHFFGDSEKHADLWQKELDFTSSLIENDVRNNSAWNHRWFTVFARPEEASKQLIDGELQSDS
jgi:protein farnesyltransferase/geranylgeranyltransferase type-1 subunit alpha